MTASIREGAQWKQGWDFNDMSTFKIQCPTEIHFGNGISKTLNRVAALNRGIVVVVRGASGTVSQPIVDDLASHGCTVIEIPVAEEPSISRVNEAFNRVRAADVIAIVACGGGSVIDAAKALRFCLGQATELPTDFSELSAETLGTTPELPLIAIPTTAGTGAEVTSNAVLASQSAKTSLRGRCLYPTVALVDPLLLQSAPASVVLGSGLDAVVQTIEAYTSCYATPFTNALSEPNLRRGVQALFNVVEHQAEEAWSELAWTSLSSGLALANGGLGAAHGLASVLGARLNAPHGMLCGRLIAPVLRENLASAERGSETYTKIERCIDVLAEVFPPCRQPEALSGFEAWLEDHKVPRLRDFSADQASFDEIAQVAVVASSSLKNAVPLTTSAFRNILVAAY